MQPTYLPPCPVRSGQKVRRRQSSQDASALSRGSDAFDEEPVQVAASRIRNTRDGRRICTADYAVPLQRTGSPENIGGDLWAHGRIHRAIRNDRGGARRGAAYDPGADLLCAGLGLRHGLRGGLHK